MKDKNKFKFLLILTFFLTAVLNPANTYADEFKNSAPKDLISLKDRLSKSFVGIECGNKTGIAFTGNYNISQANKNQGINSLLVTNKDLVWPCLGGSSRTVSVLHQGSKLVGSIYNWSALNSEDFATVSSALDLETIGLYGDEYPEVGWWVIVASYLPQFGLTWTELKISAINESDYTLLLNGAPATLGTGGPVFDNEGTFLGIVTFVQNSNSGLAKVSGAPNVCNTKGSLSGTGIANCAAGTKDQVWKKSSTNPASTDPIFDPNKEATEAINAVEDSFNAYQEALLQCQRTYNSASISIAKYLKLLKLDAACGSVDSQAKSLLSRVKALGNQKQLSAKDIELLNSSLDTMNLFAERADATNAQIEDVISYFEYVFASQLNVQKSNNLFNKNWASISSKLMKLPSNARVKITSTTEYLSIVDAKSEWSSYQKLISDFLDSITSSTNVDFIENAIVEIKESEPEMDLNEIQSSILLVSKKIPKAVCTRGRDVFVPSGNVCKSGYKRTNL